MKKTILIISLLLSGIKVFSQVGINTENPKATLDIRAKLSTSGNENIAEGLLIPRIDKEKALNMTNVENSTLIYVDNVSTGAGTASNSAEYITSTGFYMYDAENDKWQHITYKSNFFYSPSILLPTNTTDSRLTMANSGFTVTVDGLYTVDLYSLFSAQFKTPMYTSTAGTNLAEFVKPATNYHYFITSADTNVFSDITLSTDGKLSYKVISNSIIRNGSFMNIVMKEK